MSVPRVERYQTSGRPGLSARAALPLSGAQPPDENREPRAARASRYFGRVAQPANASRESRFVSRVPAGDVSWRFLMRRLHVHCV